MPVQRRLVLLAFLFLTNLSLQSPVPDVPTATQAIVTTLTVPATTSYSIATLATLVATTITKDQISKLTTKIGGTKTVITSDLGPTLTKTKIITSAVVTSYPYVSSQTIVSTIGSTTLLGPDPSTGGTSNTPSASTSSTTSASAITSSQSSITSSTPISTSSTSAGSLAATASRPLSLSPSSTSISSTGLSATAKIGIGIAIPCALIIAAGFLAAFWMGQRRVRHHKLQDYTEMDWHLEKLQRHDKKLPLPPGLIAGGATTAVGDGYRKIEEEGVREQGLQKQKVDTTFKLTIPEPVLRPWSESEYSRSDGAVAGSESRNTGGWRKSRPYSVRTRNSTIAEMPGDAPPARYSWLPLPGKRKSVRAGRETMTL